MPAAVVVGDGPRPTPRPREGVAGRSGGGGWVCRGQEGTGPASEWANLRKEGPRGKGPGGVGACVCVVSVLGAGCVWREEGGWG